MDTTTLNLNTIDEYIKTCPDAVQPVLKEMRAIIKRAAPDAEELINYGIPTFRQNGNLVHFGAAKTHLGFYPTPSAVKEFEKELSVYEGSKGAVKIPYDKPLPRALITKIVKFRIRQNLSKKK